MKYNFFWEVFCLLVIFQASIAAKKTANSANRFNLITFLYNETDEDRIAEYITCLKKNLQHALIDKIHVIYDTSKDDGENRILTYMRSQDIDIEYINGRPTYEYCFKVANCLYPNSLVILSNADIYFNDSLNLFELYDFSNKFLALTRWNVLSDNTIAIYTWPGGKKAEYSQDAWIFKTPLRKIENGGIFLGEPGCDGKIAKQVFLSGLKVLNPCLSIQCCHFHLSAIRHYEKGCYLMSELMPVPWNFLK